MPRRSPPRSSARTSTRSSADVRVQRTRGAIREGVETLLASGVERLAVSDIVQAAGVSRSSFYMHYAGVEELANELMLDAFDEIADLELEIRARSSRAESLRETQVRMVEHFVSHKALYLLARSLPGSGEAYHQAISAMATLVEQSLVDHPQLPDDVVPRLVATWIPAGAYGVLDAWCRGDFEATSEQVAQGLFLMLPAWYRDPSISQDAPSADG